MLLWDTLCFINRKQSMLALPRQGIGGEPVGQGKVVIAGAVHWLSRVDRSQFSAGGANTLLFLFLFGSCNWKAGMVSLRRGMLRIPQTENGMDI